MALSSPGSGFTLVDQSGLTVGDAFTDGDIAEGYLEKIVSSTGAATTSALYTNPYGGATYANYGASCIVTFVGANYLTASGTMNASASVTGSNARLLLQPAGTLNSTASESGSAQMLFQPEGSQLATALLTGAPQALLQPSGELLAASLLTGSTQGILQPSAELNASAVFDGSTQMHMHFSADLVGDSEAVGVLSFRPAAEEADVTGDSTIEGLVSIIHERGGYCLLELAATGSLFEVPDVPVLPALTQNFHGDGVLVPRETNSVGVIGDPSVSNKLKVLNASQLVVSPSYSGITYSLGGPMDILSSPVKLGFRKGDRLKLTGPTGSEPNHGRELTFLNPSDIEIMETLNLPDTTEYEFMVFRRQL